MDDTPLDSRHRIRGGNRLPESGQAVHAEHVNVVDSPAFQVVEHTAPELRRFVFSNPDAQDVFASIHVDAQHDIGCFGDIPVVFLYECVNKSL